ncbi:hypothetical protein Tco_0818419 [Tanacetum coccineum]
MLPKPSRQKQFEGIILNFMRDQEDELRQLEKYMDEIDDEFMHLANMAIEMFEMKIKARENEVKETLGTLMKVEPLDKAQLEDFGLNTYNNDIPLSSREVPSFDEPETQPKPLPNCPSLDVSLGEERGLEPPIKPNSLDSFKMASFHPKDVYRYNHPCLDDPKKHYGFKPGLLGHSGSLGVDFSKLEMIEDDWELESKGVSFLGDALDLPNRLGKDRNKETYHSEHLMEQLPFQHKGPSHHNGVYRYYHPHLTEIFDEKKPESS